MAFTSEILSTGNNQPLHKYKIVKINLITYCVAGYDQSLYLCKGKPTLTIPEISSPTKSPTPSPRGAKFRKIRGGVAEVTKIDATTGVHF